MGTVGAALASSHVVSDRQVVGRGPAAEVEVLPVLGGREEADGPPPSRRCRSSAMSLRSASFSVRSCCIIALIVGGGRL